MLLGKGSPLMQCTCRTQTEGHFSDSTAMGYGQMTELSLIVDRDMLNAPLGPAHGNLGGTFYTLSFLQRIQQGPEAMGWGEAQRESFLLTWTPSLNEN